MKVSPVECSQSKPERGMLMSERWVLKRLLCLLLATALLLLSGCLLSNSPAPGSQLSDSPGSGGGLPNQPGPMNLLPNVTTPMLQADYWVAKLPDPDRVIMSVEGIQAFNRSIIAGQPDLVYDLTVYPASLTRAKLAAYISRPFPTGLLYVGGVPATPAYYDNLKRLMNLDGLKDSNQVQYGFTVRRADLRTFPTGDLAHG